MPMRSTPEAWGTVDIDAQQPRMGGRSYSAWEDAPPPYAASQLPQQSAAFAPDTVPTWTWQSEASEPSYFDSPSPLPALGPPQAMAPSGLPPQPKPSLRETMSSLLKIVSARLERLEGPGAVEEFAAKMPQAFSQPGLANASREENSMAWADGPQVLPQPALVRSSREDGPRAYPQPGLVKSGREENAVAWADGSPPGVFGHSANGIFQQLESDTDKYLHGAAGLTGPSFRGRNASGMIYQFEGEKEKYAQGAAGLAGPVFGSAQKASGMSSRFEMDEEKYAQEYLQGVGGNRKSFGGAMDSAWPGGGMSPGAGFPCRRQY